MELNGRTALAGAFCIGLAAIVAFLWTQHSKATEARYGIHVLSVQLRDNCRLTNSELAAEEPLDCATLFHSDNADRVATAAYWHTLSGIKTIPDEVAAFNVAKVKVASRMKRLTALNAGIPSQNKAIERENSSGYEPHFDIGVKCRREWPSDYTMEEFCIRQQEDARSWTRGRQIEERIASHCMRNWSQDWVMFKFCAGQEEKARDRIGR